MTRIVIIFFIILFSINSSIYSQEYDPIVVSFDYAKNQYLNKNYDESILEIKSLISKIENLEKPDAVTGATSNWELDTVTSASVGWDIEGEQPEVNSMPIDKNSMNELVGDNGSDIEYNFIEASFLFSEYTSNEIRANSLYKNKYIYIKGIVKTIKEKYHPELKTQAPTIELNFSNELRYSLDDINCFFDSSSLEKIISLNIGDSIIINGKVVGIGIFGDIDIIDCTIIK